MKVLVTGVGGQLGHDVMNERINTDKRLSGFDVCRTVAAIGIIAFHFYCHSSSTGKLFYAHANGAWGGVLNYFFFAMSGLLLQLKWGEDEEFSTRSFYWKRWKSTMPAYILVWSFAFFLNVMETGQIFYLPIPKSRILLTFIGMDGYFAWVTTTYLITGEWFLGAALINYLLYPALRFICKKHAFVFAVLQGGVYFIRLHLDAINLDRYTDFIPAVAPATCVFSFYIGMLMGKNFERMRGKAITLFAILIATFLSVIPIGGSNITKEIIMGCSLLIALFNIGEAICKIKCIKSVFTKLSKLTYYTFLLHHQIIYKVLEKFDTSSTLSSLAALAAIVILTFAFSKILQSVMDAFFKSHVFSSLENALFKIGKKRLRKESDNCVNI